jgi:hypothetical protein
MGEASFHSIHVVVALAEHGRRNHQTFAGRRGMSSNPYFLHWISLPLATVLGVALTTPLQTEALGREAAQLDGYTQADGSSVFALTLKSSKTAGHGPRDVVVLFSTAASHAGDFRAKSLASLQAMLARLGDDDRVALVAFDLRATAVSKGFVAPRGPEIDAALKTLSRRTPLGACDLEKALDLAANSYAGDSQRARAVVYIGDGSSRANPLTVDQLDRLVQDLVARRAPVIGFGVGPQIDAQLLGTLVSRTGGVELSERSDVAADAQGARLAEAVHGSVFWPTDRPRVKWPTGLDVYPQDFPPLRNDRDTVLVGVAKTTAAWQFDVRVDSSAGMENLAFSVPELKSREANGYLAALVAQAKPDGGRTLPLIDSASLAEAKRQIEAGGRGLGELAREALAGGNLEGASHLAREALLRTPNNPAAWAIENVAAGRGARALAPATPALARQEGDFDLRGAALPADGAAAALANSTVSALEEQWQCGVRDSIDRARKQAGIDPARAESLLRQEQHDLLAVADIRPEIKDGLMNKLHAAAMEMKRRGEELTFRRQQRERQAAAQKEMELTVAALAHDQASLKSLMDRYDSLMAEGRHRLAEESAALAAEKIVARSQPGAGPMMVAAVIDSRLTANYNDIMATRVARQKGFVDALYQTEKANVPVADDPSIVYPDGEAWRELTARRKERYSSMSLAKPSEAEKKIEKALKDPATLEFVGTKFKDIVDYLSDVHHIEIQLDTAALKEAGFDPDTEITKSLKGISLASALKLLLDDLKLKYVIHNEVLLITTLEKAASEEYLTTKVYPVADIVLPIKDTGFKGGFGGLGSSNLMGGNQQGGNLNNPFGNQMGNGNPPGNNPLGNQMGNGNVMGNNPFGNQMGNGNPMGNGLFNVPCENVPQGR